MWTAETLSQLAAGYWTPATLIAAVELGVFDAIEPVAGIDHAPATAETIAVNINADPARTAALLDGLSAVGLLSKCDGVYSLPESLRPLLSRRSPTCMLDALAYNGDLYRQWANLADVVRGHAPAHAGRQLGADPAMTRRFVLGMEAKARAFAPALAAALDSVGVRTLLDVGAGPGTLSRTIAEADARVRPTLLDLPAVLDVSREINAASPAADRITYLPADYRAQPLPGPFDAVLYAGALHQETPASAAALFAAIAAAITPGGRVWVIDLMLDASRTSPVFSAMFQLNMLLLRPGSRVFGVDETVGLLTAAGFEGVTAAVVTGTPYHVVSGRR